MNGSVLRGELGRSRGRLLVFYSLILVPLVIHGAITVLTTDTNSPLEWVDQHFAAKVHYTRFTQRFGDGDILILSWPGCTIHQTRLDRLANVLRRAPGFYSRDRWLLASVTTGRELYQSRRRPPFELTPESALQPLRGWLVGPDNQTTCAVIAFTAEGIEQRSRLVPLILGLASEIAQVRHEDVHFAGPVADGYAVNLESNRTMERFAPISALVVFVVCLLSIRSFFAATIVFGCSLISQALSLAAVHYGGGTPTALTVVIPPLVQVLSIAGGVHLVNYILSAIQEVGPQETSEAIKMALRLGWLPCILSAVTTAVGMGSLATSGLIAVREFGIYSAIAVMLSVACLLTMIPFFMSWHFSAGKKLTKDGSYRLSFEFAACWIERNASAIVLCFLLVITGAAIGIPRIKTSVSIETLFPQESRLLRDYRWLESQIAPLVSLEVVLEFPPNQLSFAEQITCLRRVEQTLRDHRSIESVTSALDFKPSMLGTYNRSEKGSEPLRQGPETNEVDVPIEGQPPFRIGDLTMEQEGRSTEPAFFDFAKNFSYAAGSTVSPQWRFTARTSALGDQKYESILSEIRDSVSRTLAEDPRWSAAKLEFSGMMPLVHEIQTQLFKDLYSSFLMAFVVITMVMTIIQGGMIAGVLAMIPNLFPSIVLFGVLGWLGQPVDIGSIMTASIAMGIAVDDTLHFLNFFQHQINQRQEIRQAIRMTLNHCGAAMIQTTLICVAGMSVFALSDFIPTARFAGMMALLLFLALVGDLVCLPALLLSRFGRALVHREPSRNVLASQDMK